MADENYKEPDFTEEEVSGDEAAAAPEESAASEEVLQEQNDGKTEDASGDEGNGTEDVSGADDADAEAAAGADVKTTGSASSEKKSGFFSRNKKADREKAEMKEKIEGLEDKVRRQMAEFDNYRKRTEKEKDQMFTMGEKSVIEKMLPIVDNFERGFDTVDPEDKDDAFVAGMQKIYQQLMKQLTDLGVTPIEAVGKEFDPEYHNAVMQVESEELESGFVAQELQKGYMYHDQVIRHSMVSVVQ